jgi:iron complex outermembrane receptor protein
MRVNRDELRSRGLELLALLTLGPLDIAADATFQRVELRDPTAPASESRPEYQPEFVAGLNLNAALPADFAGSVQARYTGTQYCVNPDLGGDQELEPWTRVDAQLARGFRVRTSGPLARAEASVAVDNVFDEVLFDQCGLPQGGRTLRFQIRLF